MLNMGIFGSYTSDGKIRIKVDEETTDSDGRTYTDIVGIMEIDTDFALNFAEALIDQVRHIAKNIGIPHKRREDD